MLPSIIAPAISLPSLVNVQVVTSLPLSQSGCGDHALISHASLSYYELVVELPVTYNVPLTLIPREPSIFHSLLATDVMSLSRITGVLVRYGRKCVHTSSISELHIAHAFSPYSCKENISKLKRVRDIDAYLQPTPRDSFPPPSLPPSFPPPFSLPSSVPPSLPERKRSNSNYHL